MPQDYLLQQRLKRILQAVALEKPDRIPVVLQFSGFAAYVTGIRMAEYLSTPLKATEILGDHMCLMGDVPATMHNALVVGRRSTGTARGLFGNWDPRALFFSPAATFHQMPN